MYGCYVPGRPTQPICSCQPHEICHHGQCYPNPPIGLDCTNDICHGGTVCANSVCVMDPCPGRCPPDQSCRLGECRIIEGTPCVTECSGPFACIDGRCRRNDCETRVCQIGETCESGQCTRVSGRFCTWAPRDCGQAFACKENVCIDLLTPATTALPQQDNRLPTL
ncbi:Hemeadin protein [Cooperia oncophora]